MKRTLLTIAQAVLLIGTAAAFQACFYSEGPPYYEPGGRTVVLGDYDEDHVWHDRYWWASNRHDWVHEHHPDWVASETREEHEAYEHHAHPEHDHDHH